ncbi:MAG TPA: hypothetical protein VFG43_02990, partial [Geminicoccaceae bacterium]|nr:hypothetical protein [Geminicoccaceae bacterium]
RLRGSVVREQAATLEPLPRTEPDPQPEPEPPEAEAAPAVPGRWLSADVLEFLAAQPEASPSVKARLLLPAKPQGP